MSTVDVVWSKDHIVLAGDSRTSILQRVRGATLPIGWTDTASKVFCFPRALVGVACAGTATIGPYFVSYLIDRYIKETDDPSLSPDLVCEGLLHTYLPKCEGYSKNLPLYFVVCGFSEDRPRVIVHNGRSMTLNTSETGFQSNRKPRSPLNLQLPSYLDLVKCAEAHVQSYLEDQSTRASTGGPVDVLSVSREETSWIRQKVRIPESATVKEWRVRILSGKTPILFTSKPFAAHDAKNHWRGVFHSMFRFINREP